MYVQWSHVDVSDSSQEEQSFFVPLHLASANGHLTVAELLVQYDADVHIRDLNQETALHLACR
jgi:hypothetical protein